MNSIKKKQHKGTLARGNSLMTAIQAKYLQLEGESFLKKILLPFVEVIVKNENLEFEVDPKLVENSSKVEGNKRLLLTNLKSILNKIFSTKCISSTPDGIRALAYKIKTIADKYAPENSQLLVGGFIMLR